jgi:hypothetical protein
LYIRSTDRKAGMTDTSKFNKGLPGVPLSKMAVSRFGDEINSPLNRGEEAA